MNLETFVWNLTAGDDLNQTTDFNLLVQYIRELKGSPDLNKPEIIANLEKANRDEKALTLDILRHFIQYAKTVNSDAAEEEFNRILTEFLKGGHIIFSDTGGELYEKWKKGAVSRKGTSSHQSVKEQFAIRGDFVKEALFGTKSGEDGKEHTWLQLESHPTGLQHVVGHLVSYATYKITGMNIGPYGRSVHVEKTPIRLNKPRGLDVDSSSSPLIHAP